MSDTQTICLTVAVCWLSTLVLAAWAVLRSRGRVNVSFEKSVNVETGGL